MNCFYQIFEAKQSVLFRIITHGNTLVMQKDFSKDRIEAFNVYEGNCPDDLNFPLFFVNISFGYKFEKFK
jgi:hypothetical protein